VDTYGVLGDPGTSKKETQRVRTGDSRNGGDPKNCKEVPGNPCQIKKLLDGIQAQLDANGACPSCENNYERFKVNRSGLDGYNSNSWAHNMLTGAGMSAPPMPRSPGYHPAPGTWYK
jgi:hypothetical protein